MKEIRSMKECEKYKDITIKSQNFTTKRSQPLKGRI